MNSSYLAPGSEWTLTPSTPVFARLNSVSSIQSADAKVSLTPFCPELEAEFSSSTRNCRWSAWAMFTYGAMLCASPAEALSLSRLGIDGYTAEPESVTPARSG